MSLQMIERHILPPLQRRIILYLADTTPQTINEIASCISKGYKSTWRAFNSLKAKGFIEEIDVKTYRGREYDLFWLTAEGVLIAVVEGASPDTLLKTTLKLFPENKIVHCFLEMTPLFNPEVLSVGYSAIKTKGILQDIDFASMLFIVLLNDVPTQTYKDVFKTLRKYPNEYALLKTQIEKLSTIIDQLKDIIEDQ